MPRRETAWRIVARPLNDFGDVTYDVFRGSRRLAWGLKDQEAAERWVARLAVRNPLEVFEAEPDPRERAETEGDGVLAEAEPFTPRRVWWNEA